MNSPRFTLDFETRSACDLKACGSWKYSIHPTTEVLCLVWRFGEWEPGRTALFSPVTAFEDIEAMGELWEWIEAGGPVEAHNAWFEFCIWHNVLVPRWGWPAIPIAQWRCSASKAAAHALPRRLAEAGAALGLDIQKDDAGHRLMLQMSKPRRSRKSERERWVKEGITPPEYLWWEEPDKLERLIAYCRQDVLAEEALSQALPDLCPNEQQMFHLDMLINHRGFQLDGEAVTTALDLIARETRLLNQELAEVTQGEVTRATQRGRLTTWLANNGLPIPNTQKATVDDLLSPESSLTPPVRRALEILRDCGRSSTAKYQAMADWMDDAGRVRGGLLYHGATTGRWSGAGVQPHNFPRGTQKVDQEELWRVLKRGERTEIAGSYRSVMEALSNGLRGAITAAPGYELFVADYAAIEARVVLWLARDNAALNIFREGRDIYCEMASEIYGRVVTKADKEERQLGKVAVLGLGYQMGAGKFIDAAGTYGITLDAEFAQHVVNTYRTKFERVKQLWYGQEDAAVEAVETGGPVKAGYITWLTEGRFLYAQLPSGRRLAYPDPQLKQRETPWGAVKTVVTFMGIDSHTRKWKRQTTYGGSLVENLTQAVARDLMAEAMARVEATGRYRVVLSVHDELVAEAPVGTGTVEEFERLLTTVPNWASGCPIAAEDWKGTRYHK